MDDKSKGFRLDLDAADAKKFIQLLKDEGLWRSGFAIHEANNLTVNVRNDDEAQKEG